MIADQFRNSLALYDNIILTKEINAIDCSHHFTMITWMERQFSLERDIIFLQLQL